MKKALIIIASSLLCFHVGAFADGDDPAKANWDSHCKKCHAEDGSGKTKLGEKLGIKDYTDAASLAEFTDEQLHAMTKDGVDGTKMPGFAKKLSDEEISALVVYMRNMAK